MSGVALRHPVVLGAHMPRAPRHLRLWLVLTAALLVLPLTAGSAFADDLYDLDLRLQNAGFDDAYTEAYDAADADGVRVTVDFASRSTSRSDYEKETQEIGRLIWLHLEGRVLAVDVAPLTTASWTDGALPPAVSFTRQELRQAHGVRPADLDEADFSPADEDMIFGLLLFGGFWLAGVAAAVGITVAVMRARQARAQSSAWNGYGWNGYGGGPAWSGTPHAWSPGHSGWPPLAAAYEAPAAQPSPATQPPPAAQPPPVTQPPSAAQPAPGFSGSDPWRLPFGG